ncbi:MAG: phage major capsid protein [Clostridia bacterium]|nr:phage major capsid protein [Clostridia bacterium]
MKNGFKAFVARCKRQAPWQPPRVSMTLTLYALKEQAGQVQAQMATEKEALAKMLADPTSNMEANRKAKQRLSDLKERYAGLTEQIQEMEQEQKARLKEDGTGATMSKEEARGRFFQAVLNGSNVRELPKMAYEQLGAIPANNADQGMGSNLLPTNLSNELMLDPVVENPLQPYMTVTNITGLEIPKLGFSVEDDAFLSKDGETAKEMALTGDKISFGRHKMMLRAAVSESVLRSTPLNVEAAVTGGLHSAQAAKVLKVMFAQSPGTGEEHMSLYSTQNGVKSVTGSTMLDAILAAYGDLEDIYAPNARVVMRRADYIAMIRELANGAESLYGKKPEEIIGVPVVFCEKAVTPVVGDFRYLHMNFDMPPLYDTDKDVSVGNRLFVLTHWYDIKVKLAAAFRLATVA